MILDLKTAFQLGLPIAKPVTGSGVRALILDFRISDF